MTCCAGTSERVLHTIETTPELVRGRAVVDGAWSHGGRRCAAQDDLITCVHLIADAGASFSSLGPGTFDSAFKTHPRAARVLFAHGADADSSGEDGGQAMHAIAAIGFRSAAAFLLDNGADINAKTNDGKTPLDVALAIGLPRMTQFLREQGAVTNVVNLDDAAQIASPQTSLQPEDGQLYGEGGLVSRRSRLWLFT